MIEKKTLWAVLHDYEIAEVDAIVGDGEVLASKKANSKSDEYDNGLFILRYFSSEEKAKEWIKDTFNSIRDTVPKVKKFIEMMDRSFGLHDKLGIEPKDYLGRYADRTDNYSVFYDNEREYAQKLETFIKSRMLNIDGYMIPVDSVRGIKWYAAEDAEEYEEGQWKAVLTTANGREYSTSNESDVRLIWAIIGRCAGSWFVDNDINCDE